MNKIKVLILTTFVLITVFITSACSADRTCLKSHEELIMMPILVGKVVTFQYIPSQVCDQYAPDPKGNQ